MNGFSATAQPQTAYPGTQSPAPLEGPGAPPGLDQGLRRTLHETLLLWPHLAEVHGSLIADPFLHIKSNITFILKFSFLPGVQANN